MTSEQDIRQRVAAIDGAPTGDAWEIQRRQVNNTFIFGTGRYGAIGIVWDAMNAERNAEFIAHAPDDIRFLLTENERLTAALAAVTSERDAARAVLEQSERDRVKMSDASLRQREYLHAIEQTSVQSSSMRGWEMCLALANEALRGSEPFPHKVIERYDAQAATPPAEPADAGERADAG